MKKIMNKLMMAIMAFLMFVMLAGAVWQVFTRFVLRDPSIFTEELLRYTLIWATMLGAAYAFATDLHLSLVLVKDRLKGRARVILFVFNEIVVLFFIGSILIVGGCSLCARNTSQLSAILRLPMSLVYSVVPISGVIIYIIKIAQYVEMFQKRKQGEEKIC